ncbi:MAG: ATP-binding protein [Solirubrobacterales bacterium]|nr:ATP-binding protein [Solirubrobacterales bacterium]
MLALSWSGGKDSTLALEALTRSGRRPDLLLSTIDGEREVMPHHETPVPLLRRQAESLDLPLVLIEIPSRAANETYEARMREAFAGPLAEVTEVAFGDLFLDDLRSYREARMAEVGRAAGFPLWGRETAGLADDFAARFDATICSIDRDQLPDHQPAVPLDEAFLRSLPEAADPCGENGEFHTFVHDGPLFEHPVEFEIGGTVESDDGRFLHAVMEW